MRKVKDIRLLLLFVILFTMSTGCTDKHYSIEPESPSEGSEMPTMDTEEPSFSILISSGDINHRGITSYELDGNLKEHVLDLRNFGSTPNGLAAGPNGTFLTSTDGADSILQVPYSTDHSFFYGSGLFSGGIYDIEYGPVMDYYYVVETRNIEVFNSSGTRQPSAIIAQNTGACSLSAPRNMHATEDGFLYVADFSAARIHKYDINAHVATCVVSYNVSGLAPYSVIKHSNGLLYIASFTDDAVYTLDENTLALTNIFDPGLTILRDPRGMAELPDGSIIVSSSITDSIERIDEAGVRQGIVPFISDIFSLNITDIEVLSN